MPTSCNLIFGNAFGDHSWNRMDRSKYFRVRGEIERETNLFDFVFFDEFYRDEILRLNVEFRLLRIR